MGPTVRLALSGVRRRGIGQVVVLVAVTALAAAAIVAGLASRTSSADLLDAAYERAGRPDVILFGTPDALRDAARDPEIAAASEPAQRVSAETTVDDEIVEVAVTAVDPAALPAVNTPDLVDGRWPARPGEVVVERSLVVEGVVDVGDTLAISNDNGSFELHVVGSAIELTDCFWPTCDPLRVLALPEEVEAIGRGTQSTHVASYRVVDGARDAAVGSRLLREGGPEAIFGQMVWSDTSGDILIIGAVFGAMVGGFGAFLLVSACVVVAGATAARLVARRRALGLLRAVGFRPRQLAAVVLLEHAFLGAVGVAIGWVVGSLAAPGLGTVGAIVRGEGTTFDVGALLAALVLVEAFLAVAVLLPAWRAGRQPATEVLRDVPTAPAGGRVVAAVARRLGAGPSLVAGLRRAVARPVRAALATSAILIAAIGAVVSAGFINSVDHTIADPALTGNPFDAFAFTSAAGADELTAVLDTTPEVDAWYTEHESTVSLGSASYRAEVIGGDPAAARFHVQEGRALRGAGEAIVGYGFLDETGTDVGDRIDVVVAGESLELEIVGWYFESEDAGAVLTMREESLASAELEGPPTFRVVAADDVDADELAAAVAARVGNGARVIAEEPGDLGGVGAIKGSLIGFTVLLAGVAAANLLATTVASTRERARALGILRTVGCTTGQLVGQTAAGAGALGLAAAAVGVPVGMVVFRVLSDTITAGVGIGPGMGVAPAWWFLVAVAVGVTLLAAGAGALASIGLSRRPAAELVRYE